MSSDLINNLHMHVMSTWPRINSVIWRNCGWKMENKDFMTVNWMQALTTSCPGTPRRVDKRLFIIPLWLSSLLLFIAEIKWQLYSVLHIYWQRLPSDGSMHESLICKLIIHCTHKPFCGDKLKLLPCEWINSEIYGSKHHLGFMCNNQTRILKFTTG